MKAKVVIMALALALVPAFAFPYTLTELDINAGLLFIGSAPPAGYGTASPITQTLGVSFLLESDGPWFLIPSIEFLGTYYEWTGSRAVPTGYEVGTGVLTFGSLLSLQAGVFYPVTKGLEVGGAVGLAAFLRFPAESQNSAADTGSGLTYFYGEGRFLYPEASLFTKWHVADGVTLVFTLRGTYPIFHLWDGENLPFYDQLLAGFDLGFAIGLGGRKAQAPGAQPASAPASTPAPAR